MRWMLVVVAFVVLQTEGRADVTKAKGVAAKCRSVSEKLKGDEEKSWATQFQVFERVKGGDLYPITDDSHVIDARSDLVIRRIADDPPLVHTVSSEDEYEEIVRARKSGEVGDFVKQAQNAAIEAQKAEAGAKAAAKQATQRSGVAAPQEIAAPESDDPCAIQRNDGFDIDVTVFGPVPDQCPTFARVGRIQYSDIFNLYPPKYPEGCRVGLAALTQQRSIAKNTDLVVYAGTYRHGDRIEIHLYGDRIRDFDTVENCKEAAGTRTCDVRHNTTWGQLESLSVNVVDFRRLVPLEIDRRDFERRIIATSTRVDIARDIVIDFVDKHDPVATWLTYGEKGDVLIEAKATHGGSSRDLQLSENGGRMTLVGLKAEESVLLTIKRRVKSGESSSYVAAQEFRFTSVARGFHYDVKGDYAARYGTSSALALRGGVDDPSGWFAQTFAYTFYIRRREPGFLDHFGFGFHVALLLRGSDGDEGETEDQQVDAGFGGQITFGANVIHLGAGYSFRADRRYLLIGIDLPDLVKLISGKE